MSTMVQILEVKTNGGKAYYWIDGCKKFVAKVRGDLFSSNGQNAWTNENGVEPGTTLAKLDGLAKRGEGRLMSYLEWVYECQKDFR